MQRSLIQLVPRSMRSFLAVPLLSILAVCSSCFAAEDDPNHLTIFAASSLTNAFEELVRTYEEQYPDTDVQLTFAGSQILRFQIEQGASTDLFASANETHMQALVDADLMGTPRTLGITDLVVIVPQQNPAQIERFDDLDQASSIVVGTVYVPIGAYTERVLELASAELGDAFVNKVRDRVVSRESNVRLVRAKVELGEADAALVYRTDATASKRVRLVPIPEKFNVQARFPIAMTTETTSAGAATRFLDYIASPEARGILESHGFVTES